MMWQCLEYTAIVGIRTLFGMLAGYVIEERQHESALGKVLIEIASPSAMTTD